MMEGLVGFQGMLARRGKVGKAPGGLNEGSCGGLLRLGVAAGMVAGMRNISRSPGAETPGNETRGPETIEMTPDGRFIDPPRVPIAGRVFRSAIVVAVVAAAMAVAALLAWFALMLIPVALAAGVIAWGAWRWQMWRGRRPF